MKDICYAMKVQIEWEVICGNSLFIPLDRILGGVRYTSILIEVPKLLHGFGLAVRAFGCQEGFSLLGMLELCGVRISNLM